MNARVQMERVISGGFHNHAGIIVLSDGEKVYESYDQGYTAGDWVHVASVTKSILSLLIGMAVNQGYMDVGQRVLDFFPEYVVARGEKTIQQITVRDMLTMTAPYRCKTEPYVKMFTGKEWVRMALDSLGGSGRIGEFTYSPLLGVQALSGIFVRATGQPILSFAKEHLFEPLGIMVQKDLRFASKEEQLAFLKARDISGWAADPEGIQTAGWGLTLTTMDMARIGQLCLNEGAWEGRQLVSAQWIDESTHEHSRCRQWKLSYGYLWWVIDDREHIYAAMGDGGNIIYVNAKKKLVIAIACTYMPQAKNRLQLIRTYMEPVFG